MTLPLVKHTLICNTSNQRILFWMFDTSLFKCSYNPIFANDVCQPQMVPHNYYFEYLIIHSEYLIIAFERHTLQWSGSYKILEMVFVRYALSKDELILKTVAIFVQKAGLIWQQGGFSLN